MNFGFRFRASDEALWTKPLSRYWKIRKMMKLIPVFRRKKFSSNNLFRPLSSHSSKDIANCLEVALPMQENKFYLFVVLKNCHVFNGSLAELDKFNNMMLNQ